MTTFLWILLAGFILGILLCIIFSFTKYKQVLCMISISLSIVCLVFFVVDISVNPVKNIENVSATQENEKNYIDGVEFSEIYKAYKKNELKADELYKNKRYLITAKVNGMSTGGLLNLSGGATLTMEINVDNTIVYFYASFEKDQEESLKNISVGDTITFEGECLSAGTWSECKLIEN